jgi:uncharacterized membrane protein YfcA
MWPSEALSRPGGTASRADCRARTFAFEHRLQLAAWRVTIVQVYLPIADMPVNIFLIFGMGLAVGFLSGMLGIGGGFLLTPLLIFLGIAPAIAVATVTSHISASLFSGSFAYWRRKALDPALAGMLIVSGLIGTACGVWLISLLRAIGQIDLVIGVSYFVLLGVVGAMMIVESSRAIL